MFPDRQLFFASVISRRRHEPLIFLLQQAGELQAATVAVLRTDDLHAHRQAASGEADGRDARRQIGDAGIAGPEGLGHEGILLSVDDGVAVMGWGVDMGEGGGQRRRHGRALGRY